MFIGPGLPALEVRPLAWSYSVGGIANERLPCTKRYVRFLPTESRNQKSVPFDFSSLLIYVPM